MTDLLVPLGRIPSGIYILTIGKNEQATGMLASWVMQAGFMPPMVTVAVRHGRYVADWLADGAPFVLNLVGDGEKHWLKHFARGFEPGEPAFEGVATREAPSGTPLLAEAIGYLDCQPTTHFDSGDHRIFLANVTGGEQLRDASPMVHVRKSGAHY